MQNSVEPELKNPQLFGILFSFLITEQYIYWEVRLGLVLMEGWIRLNWKIAPFCYFFCLYFFIDRTCYCGFE